MTTSTVSPSSPILSFSPPSPTLASSRPPLPPLPISPRSHHPAPAYPFLPRDPSSSPHTFSNFCPPPLSISPKHRSRPLPYSHPPSTLYFTSIVMCRPSSPIDRFYSPKKTKSDPMRLPCGMDTLNDITQDGDRRFAFFLDYDGTLTPIVDNPDRALIAEETRDVISDLAGRFDTAIVTGRSLNKVRNLMKLDNCYYAGSHGWDIQGPKGSQIRKRVGDQFLAKFEKVLESLDDVIDRFVGATVEDNVFSISIHYRNCSPGLVDDLEDEVDRIVDELGMVKRYGKKVFEIRPAFNWHKGKAVEYLVKTLKARDSNIIPIYIGDDVTDEDAFKALNGRGISVIVADSSTKRSTYADLRLKDPQEVQTFLSYFARRV